MQVVTKFGVVGVVTGGASYYQCHAKTWIGTNEIPRVKLRRLHSVSNWRAKSIMG